MTTSNKNLHNLAVGEAATHPIIARTMWNATDIRLVAGQEYRFSATGQWVDWYIQSSADGFASPNLFMRLFERLRRAPEQPWFALIGAINCDPRTQFLIGGQRTIVASAGGELTCFANDVQWAYWNNRASVDLTITRIR